MIRRAVSAAALVTVLATSNVLAASSIVRIRGTGYIPASTTVTLGGAVQWRNKTAKKRTVSPDTTYLTAMFFPTVTVAGYSLSAARTFTQAGSFGFHDNLKAIHGTVAVPMSASAYFLSVNETVTLYLGTVSTTSGGQPVNHYVQASKNGGAWTTIAQTSATTFGWKVTSAGTWTVRTYLHHALSGINTGVSPTITITAS